MANATELLTADELASRLRVRPDTVRSWARRGLIPTLRISPKVLRYDLQAVLDAVKHGNETRKGAQQR